MVRIVVVLVLGILFAVGGLFGTMEVARQMQNSENTAPPSTGDIEKDLMASQKFFNQSSGDMAKRQTYGLVGGAVGLVVGLGVGVLVANKLAKPRAAA